MGAKDLWVELKPDQPSYMVLRGTYGEKIHSAFHMTRQGVRWRFFRLLNDIYVSAFETVLFIERNGSDDLNDLFECKSVRNLELRLGLNTLTKHMFVAGVPGSGKTTAVFNLLVQLFRHDVPFLVIEPAKTEYRILKTLHEHPDPTVRAMAERVRVYTPGNEQCSPLRFNPLAFPENISVDEHIGQVLTTFEAAMPMGGPLQALLAEAVEAV